MTVIVELETHDVRFPTSRHLDGSDAMNPFPDYSAAYVVLRASDGTEGHALAFTVGRGTEVQVAGIRALAPLVVGQDVDEVLADLGGLGRRLTGDSQLRWLGPQKGVIQMAAGAVVNAAWDLRATREGKPLWRLLADLPAQDLVDLVDFRYLRDALTPQEALDILGATASGRQERERDLLERGYPAYTTTPGWLGYDDEKLDRLSKEAVAEGFGMIKIKVGAELDSDVRRLSIARQAVGPTFPIAVDANQIWGVEEAIEWIRALAPFDPYWIEEPTSPDDILGHQRVRSAVTPIRVATGEHGQNPVLFKQLLQSGAIDVLQLDATRVCGVNDNVANLLLAAKFGVPVCPHAGGVGLCEMVQHLAMFDYLAVSGSVDGRMVEYVDHLHGHFVEPARIVAGHYTVPREPGIGARMRPESLAQFSYPYGPAWADVVAGPPAGAPPDGVPR
jgi:L-fuconate dehydratase